MKEEKISKTLAGRTYNYIRRDIINGVLPAGSKLRMGLLSNKYDVGLTPLREGLARLVGDSLVITEGQRGFWVAPLSIEEHEDISTVRSLLETEAMTLSIQNADDKWDEELTQCYENLASIESSLQDTPTDYELHEWELANHLYHQALVSACGSPWLIKIRDLLYRQAERYRHISLISSSNDRDIHDEHEAIFHAAINRQTLKASRLIEMHLQRTTDAVRDALKDYEPIAKLR